MPWTGSCKHCGRCCKWETMWIGFANDAVKDVMAEFVTARGYKIVQVGPGRMQVKFKKPCVQLHGRDCKIYEDRPAYCRAFPEMLAQQPGIDLNRVIPHGCGFRWVE